MGAWDALGGFGSSIVTGLFSSRNTDKTNQKNYEAVLAQNASNEKIAQQNLDFQRENLDYQKALQNQIFEREDTAYQRTVDDMRAAGLSPLSMQNTNGAGQVIDTQAMNNDMQYERPEYQDNVAGINAAGGMLQQALQNAFNNQIQRDSLRLQKTTAETNALKTKAEAENIQAQTEAQNLENAITAATKEELIKKAGLENANVGSRTAGQDVSNDINRVQRDRVNRQYQYEANYGLVEGMTAAERATNIALHELGVDTSYNSDVDGLEKSTKDKVRKINRAKEAIERADTALGLSSWFRSVRGGRDVDDSYASGYDNNPAYKHYED